MKSPGSWASHGVGQVQSDLYQRNNYIFLRGGSAPSIVKPQVKLVSHRRSHRNVSQWRWLEDNFERFLPKSQYLSRMMMSTIFMNLRMPTSTGHNLQFQSPTRRIGKRTALESKFCIGHFQVITPVAHKIMQGRTHVLQWSVLLDLLGQQIFTVIMSASIGVKET